jgi:hypothetical protein
MDPGADRPGEASRAEEAGFGARWVLELRSSSHAAGGKHVELLMHPVNRFRDV